MEHFSQMSDRWPPRAPRIVRCTRKTLVTARNRRPQLPPGSEYFKSTPHVRRVYLDARRALHSAGLLSLPQLLLYRQWCWAKDRPMDVAVAAVA
eukprot:8252175-Pyramimonas_sp.AAC.2